MLELFLGILSAMGGFVDIGELVFAVDAGAKFGSSLLWVAVVGTLGIIVYAEMAGRIAAVTGLSIFDVVRDRVGFRTGLAALSAAVVVNLMTCAAEIGGVAIILNLLLPWRYRLSVALAFIALLISMACLPFKWIERTFGLLGLFLIVFIACAVSLGPDWRETAAGLLPNLPPATSSGDHYLYAYFGVALLSAIMLPYEIYFYNAGAVEDHWRPEDINTNRFVSIAGFTLGAVISISLILIGAEFFKPLHVTDTLLPGAAGLAAMTIYGRWGLTAALLGMLFAFSGAAIETCFSAAYNFAQFWGWPWGKFRGPRHAARWYFAWIALLIAAAAITLTGIDPVGLVEYSIVFSIVILPLTYLPVLSAARDKTLMGRFANGPIANGLGWFYLILITAAATAAIPLLIATRAGKV